MLDDRIKKVMASVLGIDAESISVETSPDNVDKWDSLRHMRMVIALEEEFGIKFDDDDIPNLLNLKIIRNAVESALK
jgi:acyl carrier protein